MQSHMIYAGFVSLGIIVAADVAAFEPLPQSAPVPIGNPMSDAKVQLGKQLYFDPRLSLDGTVSCNSCHNVMANGTDNRTVSKGVFGHLGERNAPTVWNAAFMTAQFWDGRAADLETQAKGPFLNSVEMGMPSGESVEQRVKDIPGYKQNFIAVFGAGEASISFDNIARAIAAFERTLITPNSPFDYFVRGDEGAIGDAAKRGMQLVENIGCTSCHTGVNFSGPELPAGNAFLQPFPIFKDNEYIVRYKLDEDEGKFESTHRLEDKHMFKVPSWRNVALTAPYFHNGAVATLDEAVRVMAKTQLNTDLDDNEISDIVAFLNSLSGEFPQLTLPRLPESPNETVISESPESREIVISVNEKERVEKTRLVR